MATSKSVQKQLELVQRANALCRDWPVGEARGLHPSFHKSMHETWNAAAMLGLLIRSNEVDQGGYTRYTRTAQTPE